MARTKNTKSAPAKKAARKAAPIRKTPVLKKAKAQPGAAVTLVLTPENNGVTAASLINSLRTLHPDAPVEFSSETFEQRQRSEEQAAKNLAMLRQLNEVSGAIRTSDPENGASAMPRLSPIGGLLQGIDRALDSLHSAISVHESRIDGVLGMDGHGEEDLAEGSSPTNASELVLSLEQILKRLQYADERVAGLTRRVQL